MLLDEVISVYTQKKIKSFLLFSDGQLLLKLKFDVLTSLFALKMYSSLNTPFYREFQPNLALNDL